MCKFFNSRMAQPHLQDRHSLVGKDKIPLIRRIRDHTGDVPPLARIGKDSIQTMTMERVDQEFQKLTGRCHFCMAICCVLAFRHPDGMISQTGGILVITVHE